MCLRDDARSTHGSRFREGCGWERSRARGRRVRRRHQCKMKPVSDPDRASSVRRGHDAGFDIAVPPRGLPGTGLGGILFRWRDRAKGPDSPARGRAGPLSGTQSASAGAPLSCADALRRTQDGMPRLQELRGDGLDRPRHLSTPEVGRAGPGPGQAIQNGSSRRRFAAGQARRANRYILEHVCLRNDHWQSEGRRADVQRIVCFY